MALAAIVAASPALAHRPHAARFPCPGDPDYTCTGPQPLYSLSQASPSERAMLTSGLEVRDGEIVAAPAVPSEEAVEVACDKCASSEVVELLYRDVLGVPFVIGEGVEADRRIVSVHIKGTTSQVRAEARSYLSGLGYVDQTDTDVHNVSLPPPPEPPKPKAPPPPPRLFAVVYHPQWRDAVELASELAPLFPSGRFSAGGGGGGSPVLPPQASMGSANSAGGGGLGASPSGPTPPASPPARGASDVLVFYGSDADQVRLAQLLPQVDTASPQVVIRATVFEVDLATDDGSAFNLATALLRQKLTVGINAQPTASASAAGLASSAALGGIAGLAGNEVSFGTSNLDLVISALSADSRFHLVTSPMALARSGGSTALSVGEQVPVLASVSYAGVAGNAVQSVDYKDSGVILDVQPVVRGQTIDLTLHQEISSFTATTTGVNNTPTLQDRSLDTQVDVADGEVIGMAGLTQSNRGKTRSGLPWPLSFLGSNERTTSRTDVLMVIQVSRVNRADGSPTWAGARLSSRTPPIAENPLLGPLTPDNPLAAPEDGAPLPLVRARR